MRLIGLALVLAVSLTLAPLAAEAQQTEKISRIGFMSVSSREPAKHLISIFFEAMRERGWVEGRNLFIEWCWAEGMVERLPDFAAELVRLNVDLIVAPETTAALAVKHATRTIPVVFVFARDPVADNLVASLARSGGERHRADQYAHPGHIWQAAGVAEGDCSPSVARRRAVECCE